jgi:hypothetical protein
MPRHPNEYQSIYAEGAISETILFEDLPPEVTHEIQRSSHLV